MLHLFSNRGCGRWKSLEDIPDHLCQNRYFLDKCKKVSSGVRNTVDKTGEAVYISLFLKELYNCLRMNSPSHL